MDNEVSISINIMIELLIMSIVVTFLMLFVAMGHTFERTIVQTVADSQADSYGTELKSAEEHGSLPAPAMFLILERNRIAIRTINGNVYGIEITKPEDLTSLFDKKVKVDINEVDEMYDVTILEE